MQGSTLQYAYALYVSMKTYNSYNVQCREGMENDQMDIENIIKCQKKRKTHV
jgi:hypothetical protein